MSIWTKNLNPEQIRAVEHNHGPLLILAGAGSGKTTVLVSRTGRLIADHIAKPSEICVLTFTNKAAKELKHRVTLKVGGRSKGLWSGTFHSFGLQMLRRFHRHAGLSPYFGIVDQSDCNSILKDLIKDINNSTKDNFDIDKLLTMINEQRMGLALQHEGMDEYHEMVEVLTPKFNKRLELLGVVDFEGLLIKPLQLFDEHPEILEKMQHQFSQVMVDEFQDTNLMQMKLIHKLVAQHQNITAVGDDDQSIYGWRGAEVKNILHFPREFKNCEVIKLERNYRSSAEILSVANAVIAKNKNRHGKVLKAEMAQSMGEKPELFILEREEDECEFVVSEILHFQKMDYQFKDFAVLYRSNTQGGLIEASLRRAQIPYSITGGTSMFDRKEVKDILAYLKQSLAPNEVSLRRIINVPPRGIGDGTVEKIVEFSQKEKIHFIEACERWKDAGVQDQIGESIEGLLFWLHHLAERIIKGSWVQTEEGTRVRDMKSPGGRMLDLLTEFGYRQYIYAHTADPTVAEKKWVVVEILGRVLDSYLMKRQVSVENLKSFLDAMMLRDDMNEDSEENKVQLMTLHASKGLEFPVVILAGLEEDLLPHKTLGGDIDEERRLFYVGVTRAKKHLVMSRCVQRKKHGIVRNVAPSRFLLEIPPDLLKQNPQGARAVTEDAREDMMAAFFKKFESMKEPEQ